MRCLAVIPLLLLGLSHGKSYLHHRFVRTVSDSGKALHERLQGSLIDKVHTPACLALGFDRIERVSKRIANSDTVTAVRVNQTQSWKFGKYAYPACRIRRDRSVPLVFSEKGGEGGNKERQRLTADMVQHGRPVVLTVADSNYADAVRIWAQMVLDSNASCTVVALDENMCNMAEAFRCRCFPIYHRKAAGAGGKVKSLSWKGVRKAAVRDRFRGALAVLKEGRSVIMQDADAIFYPGGLSRVLEFISVAEPHSDKAISLVSGRPDFIVQDNGSRDKVFDDLNWGFSFLRPSNTTINILECLLDNWEHNAFTAPRTKDDRKDTYFMRSQPRINHVIELTILHGETARPSICTFPSKFLHSAVRHMTGFSDAYYKLICARSEGLLHSPSDHVLAYDVPREASPNEQRTALSNALDLAIPMGYKVALPWAHDENGERVPLCMLLFFANTERVRGRLAARLEYPNSCANDSVEVLELNRISGFLRQHTEKHRKHTSVSSFLANEGRGDRICLNFTSLVDGKQKHRNHNHYHKTDGAGGPFQIRVCNPHEAMYSYEHMCMTDVDYGSGSGNLQDK